MAEPVANVEIEDVLSSIRRLVSEHVRNERPSAAKNMGEDSPEAEPEAESDVAPAAGTGQPAGDMLLLTPALRVAQGDDELAVDEEAPTAQARAGLSNTIRDAVHDAVDAAIVEISVEPEETAPAVAEETPAGSLSFAHHAAAQDDEGLTSLEDRIAGLEAAVALSADDEWEPDGAGLDDDNAAAPVEALNWEDHDADDEVDEIASAPEPEAETPDAIEAAELASPDMPEEVPDVVSEAAVEDATAPEEMFDDIEDADADMDFAPQSDVFAAEETVLDEGALREIVAEIVRQELQGSLGERITRNVRKLVRREIHRALAARELD
jgi:cell pole-organizing protein PopZ